MPVENAETLLPPVLTLRGFSVAFGDTTIVRDLDLAVMARGVTSLVGNGGAGKSTLLRTLAGHNDAQPALKTWGEASLLGRPLGIGPRPSLVGQNAKLLLATVAQNLAFGLPDREHLTLLEQRIAVRAALEQAGMGELRTALDTSVVDLSLGLQRRLAIVRTILADPPLVLLDEPTVGLEDDERGHLIDLLQAEATRRAILLVTHDRKVAIALGGRTVLLAQGRIHEVADTASFFRAPTTAMGRLFVETGTCYLPEPTPAAVETAPDEEVTAAVEVAPPTPPAAAPRPPRSLHWVLPHRLAGLPRPGLLEDLEADLTGLAWLGVEVLVNLEETETVPRAAIVQAGLTPIHLPIVDMDAPSATAAFELCEAIDRAVRAGRPVAVHCRAGLGRTGTILAAYLIFTGLDALDALERVRRVQPRFVQSKAQLDFLERFAGVVLRRRQEPLIVRNTLERKQPECLSTKP